MLIWIKDSFKTVEWAFFWLLPISDDERNSRCCIKTRGLNVTIEHKEIAGDHFLVRNVTAVILTLRWKYG